MATQQQQQASYTVEQLVAVNPYNPDILSDLENCVNEQISASEHVQLQDQFKTLIVLSHYLETARFCQFWDEAAKNRSILDVVPGFDQAIQNYAIHALSMTYQKVPRTVLAEVINMEGVSFDKFVDYQVANSGWALDKSQARSRLIVLSRNEFNHPELKKNTADTILLEHVTRIFPILG